MNKTPITWLDCIVLRVGLILRFLMSFELLISSLKGYQVFGVQMIQMLSCYRWRFTCYGSNGHCLCIEKVEPEP